MGGREGGGGPGGAGWGTPSVTTQSVAVPLQSVANSVLFQQLCGTGKVTKTMSESPAPPPCSASSHSALLGSLGGPAAPPPCELVPAKTVL